MPSGKRSPSVAARLTRKVGPLPVWGWAALILGGYFLYTRLHGGSGSSSATPAASASTDTTGMDTGATGSSSSGSADQLTGALDTNTALIDQLTSQLLSFQPVTADVAGNPTPGAVPSASDTPATQPTPAAQPSSPTATATATVSAKHPTQNTAGVLKWGGISFTTKAQFDSWARAHGTTTAHELSNHPQARAIYSTLR